MVAHDAEGLFVFHHGTHDFKHPHLSGSTIYQVTEKQGLATLWCTIPSVLRRVPKADKKLFELLVLPVDITNHIKRYKRAQEVLSH